MKVAKLISQVGDSTALLGTIKLVNGQLVADTSATKLCLEKTLHWNGRDFTAVDGEAFLDILPEAFSGSYVGWEVVDEPEAPQRHAREPEGHAWPSGRKRPGCSSIPGILLDIARGRSTPTTEPSGPS